MIIDLPPHIEQAIIDRANKQGLTVQEMLAKDYQEPAKPITFYDLAMAYDGVDVADVVIDEMPRTNNANRYVEFD